MIRKTIVYDADDTRVDLADCISILVREEKTKNHIQSIHTDEVGYILGKFRVDRPLPNDAVSMTLTCKIGNRTDTFKITKTNYKNVIWEIFSDKYFNETSFTYDLQVEVAGPNFMDEPVRWGTSTSVRVDLAPGGFKWFEYMLRYRLSLLTRLIL